MLVNNAGVMLVAPMLDVLIPKAKEVYDANVVRVISSSVGIYLIAGRSIGHGSEYHLDRCNLVCGLTR